MSDNQYKTIDNQDNHLLAQVKKDLEQNLEKFRDPIILGELTFRLLEERENTNRILKNVLAKVEQLEAKLNKMELAQTTEVSQKADGKVLLPEIDEQILGFIRENGKATAETVRAKFNYKGKNAASARLNRLTDMGLLRKTQVGKKVFFFP